MSLICNSAAYGQAFAWYPSSTLVPGSGIEINSPALLKESAVQFDSITPASAQTNNAPQLVFDAAQLPSTRALETFVTFDFDMDANFLFFSGGTAVPWLSDFNFQGPSFVFGLRGYSDYGRFVLNNPSITPDAKAVAPNLAAFESQYGDAYVSQVRKAALVTVIFSLDDPSPSEIADLHKMIGASLTYSISNGQADGNFDQFLMHAITYGPVNFLIYSRGGPVLTAQTGIIGSNLDIATMDSLLSQFAAGITETNIAPVTYYTSPYTALGVTLPPPPSSTVQRELISLADHYYSAAQEEQKIKMILDNWTTRYDYLDRSLYETFRSDRSQLAGYSSMLTFLAPKINAGEKGTAIPDLPALNVPWPNPTIDLTYHLVTVNGATTAAPNRYVVVDASIHNAMINDIVLLTGTKTAYDLQQSKEDEPYLLAHVVDNNFLYNGQIIGGHGIQPGTTKSDSYVMRWVLPGQTPDLDSLTAVAVDANGRAIATCPIHRTADDNLASPPANQLSE